jgi:hypothetical protein
MKLVDMYFWQIGYERRMVTAGALPNNAERSDAPEPAGSHWPVQAQ